MQIETVLLNVNIIMKKCETSGTKYEDYECFPEYTNHKDDLIVYKFLCCNRNYQKSF